MGIYLKQLALGPMRNFVYLVGPEERPETAVVDPAWDAPAILAAARADGRRLVRALLTHHHADHLNALAPLLDAETQLRACVHDTEFDELPRRLPRDRLTRVRDRDAVDVGGLLVTCLHTPGHTQGSLCFLVREDGRPLLLSGDTLFVDACGRCDLDGGDAGAMYESLHRVLGGLPDATLVYPGHDYGDAPVSSLGRERENNPWMRLRAREDFVARRSGRA